MSRQLIISNIEKETISIGFSLIKNKNDLDSALAGKDKKILVLVNSLCKSVGAKARSIASNVLSSVDKNKISAISIFSGIDKDFDDYFFCFTKPNLPSSPSIVIFENGELSFLIERHEIQSIENKEIVNILKKVLM
jgi:putative YphP/YqiW family bacilliredoxin